VRKLVVDVLDPEQLERLHAAHQQILAGLDPTASTRPEWIAR
jgi:hypothetical protein